MKITISFLLVICCCISTCFSSPVSISDGVFTSDSSIGRTLLQTKKPCPVSFESMNYTIITSKCQGPKYPADLCCGAFKDFACPYSEYLNDETNDCASTMFIYINRDGNYPPGLFAALCRDDKIGLVCPSLAPEEGKGSVNTDSNNSYKVRSPSMLMAFNVVVVIFLFRWF